MEVRSGYKQTEVGVIPEDWEVVRLGCHTEITKLAGFEYSNHFNSYKDGGDIIVIRGTNITHNSLNLSDVRTIPQSTSDKLPRSKLKKGDLVFAYVGTIGPVFLIDEENKYHLGPNTARITCTNGLHPRFLFCYFLSDLIRKEITERISTGAQPSLSMTKIRDFRISKPTKAEQEAIAEALGDADALIESVEQLLAKKRDLKQGAMQELLMGKKRLPGFSGEWEFCVVRCKQGVSHPGYVYFHMFAASVTRQIEALLTGSNYPAINGGDVRALQIPFPEYEEQTAIAAILSDMDAEIATLEMKLAKGRQLKQGMMQDLLAGRIRLV